MAEAERRREIRLLQCSTWHCLPNLRSGERREKENGTDPPPLFSECCNFAMPAPPADNDENSRTPLSLHRERRPVSSKCLSTLRTLLAPSASAKDLRFLDHENDAEYESSPRGVLEGFKNGIGSDISSPNFQESRFLPPIPGRPFVHWRKLVNQWKHKSLKHLNTFPRITKKWSKREQYNEHDDGDDDDGDLQHSIDSNLCYFKPSWKIFLFAQLKIATDGFSEENLIGKGGYSEVYKGCLPDGQLIAVKRLIKGSPTEQSSSFLAELEVFVNVDHHNVANLIGYGTERGIHLVFELSSRGSLGSLLRGSRECLDWATRYKIALGIAEGLVYLHDHCEERLIHRDIKSDNILLKENYQPQVSWFPQN